MNIIESTQNITMRFTREDLSQPLLALAKMQPDFELEYLDVFHEGQELFVDAFFSKRL